ncbi:hypothetical protein DFP92_103250 [Yoonia sediminilitoris]|uniref:Probable membrane transporter protein n=2 Tax=Yoonia sediminilitoris TaxID=1286148 RepID=A0A2T6KKC9_9RHOB|nr:hypothetical protein C8N45_103250 [Yoonia sediminilitoris]RCW96744.1 hypothetical protein DFP92_103250 [Yoonia sediminilitoris]
MFWVAATFAAIFVGLGKGGVPVVTALAVPVLALVISPIAAAGLLLPVYIVADFFGLMAYRKYFNGRVLLIMMVAMPPGVLLGYLTVDLVSEALIVALLGLIGAVFALTMMLRSKVEKPARRPKWGAGLFWGGITGFTSFVSHSGGVPYQVYTLPLKMEKLTFTGTMIIAFAYINLIKLIPYYALGQLNVSNLKIAFVLMVPAGLAVLSGVRLVRILPEKLFFKFIVWALLLLSLKLLWDGVSAL